jgi:hypothetical protein
VRGASTHPHPATRDRHVGVRLLLLLAALTSGVSLSMVLTPIVLAAPSVVPLPGEDFLTPGERQAALRGMADAERAAIGHLFADDAPELVVAYARREYTVIEEPDGSRSAVPQGSTVESPTGRISLPQHLTAACCVSGGKSGTALWVSFTVTRTRTAAPHEWKLYGNAQWGRSGTYSPAGMDCCNNDDDSLAMAWGNNLALHSDSGTGRYQSWCNGEPSSIPVSRSDVSANRGVAHAFREWWDPDNCPMYWASTTNHIRKSTYSNVLTNATLKYFHTWSNPDYTISFGSRVTISISPTRGQWALPLYVTFNS